VHHLLAMQNSASMCMHRQTSTEGHTVYWQERIASALAKNSVCTPLICMLCQQQETCTTNKNSLHASTNINMIQKVAICVPSNRLRLCVPEKPSFTFLSRKLASMFKLCSCREQTALSTCAICRSFSNFDSANFSRVATMAYAAACCCQCLFCTFGVMKP